MALNLFKSTVGLAMFLVTLPMIGVPLQPAGATAADWMQLIVSGVLGIGVADTLFLASLNRLGAGTTAVVDGLYSPFVILCAWVYLGEPIGSAVLIAMALMIGAILLSTSFAAVRGRAPKQVASGIALGVAGIFLMSVGLVIAKPVLAHSDAWWVTTVRLAAGTIFLAIQATTRQNRADVVRTFRPSRTWRLTVPAGMIGCYLAMITWILGLKYTFASKASVLNQTSTVFVVLLAALFLKEQLTARRGLAVGLAMAGATLVTWT
ncbi:MAG: DMT family transporter [Polyangiaceae bacterium]|nr:DMT family transporter [Polyangiaceae bacterium]